LEKKREVVVTEISIGDRMKKNKGGDFPTTVVASGHNPFGMRKKKRKP
jgi:hypothetical protein